MSDITPVIPSAQDTRSEIDVLSEDTNVHEEDVVISDKEDEGSTTDNDEDTILDENAIPEDESTEDENTDEETNTDDETEETDENQSEEPSRPSWQLIKEKYPELAKNNDFKNVYFREQKFTELFPTVDEAQEAAHKSELLDTLDTTLAEGNVEQIFSNLNEKALERFSKNVLPSLYKVNKEYFKLAARPIIVDMFHTAWEQAEKSGNEDLKKSVRNVLYIITGNKELPKRDTTSSDPSIVEERKQLQKERENLFLSQQQTFLNATDKSVLKRVESLVLEGLDPKKELSDYMRQVVVEKTIAEVKRMLTSDEGLTGKIRQLFRQASKANFPDEYRSRIVAASLDRAKRIIPVLRNKHRTAALGKQSTTGENPTKKIVGSKTETVKSGTSRVTSAKQIDTRKTSAEDFLNGRVTLRK